jgi:hypothetical protein
MNKYIVKIGAVESDVTLVESVPTIEKLVEASDIYAAHKKGFFDCYPGQEVLVITDTQKNVLYTFKDGFKQ